MPFPKPGVCVIDLTPPGLTPEQEYENLLDEVEEALMGFPPPDVAKIARDIRRRLTAYIGEKLTPAMYCRVEHDMWQFLERLKEERSVIDYDFNQPESGTWTIAVYMPDRPLHKHEFTVSCRG